MAEADRLTLFGSGAELDKLWGGTKLRFASSRTLSVQGGGLIATLPYILGKSQKTARFKAQTKIKRTAKTEELLTVKLHFNDNN